MNEKEIIISMLGTFHDMLKECESKGYNGATMDHFRSEINKLNDLAHACSSVEEFTNKVQQEDLFTQLGQSYANVLTEGLSKPQTTTSNHLDALLAQHIDAIKLALQAAQQQEESDFNKRLIAQLEKRIQLAEQSANYPQYLMAAMEHGLDENLQQLTFSEETLKEEMEYYEHYALCPLDFQHKKEIYDLYSTLKQKNQWVDPILFEHEERKIDHEYKAKIRAWDTFYSDLYSILDELHNWATAHCPRAPYVFPWNLIQDELKKRFTITADKGTRHLIIINKIKRFEADHSISFLDAFTHPIFEYKARQNDCPYQSFYILHLLKEVLPMALKKTSISFSAIKENETFHIQKRINNSTVPNYMISFKDWYIKKHGKEAYEKQYGSIAVPLQPVDWSFDEFKKELSVISL